MTDRNRIKLHSRRQALRQQKLRHRRGVLLLVVLSMLVLFMLVGTTFLLTSKHGFEAAKNEARLNQYENQPSDLMERALKQIVRDTQNPFSVVRYHSLLRDMYGADGFILPASTNPIYVSAEYAAADATLPQGLTKGQLIDIIVAPIANTPPPAIKLDRDANGATVPYSLSQTNGYYNGALLTFLSGQPAGKTVRVIDFVFDTSDPANIHWRFRVMNCSRGDGSPLYLPPLEANQPGDLTGVGFLVNGRQFNGTGVGYNPLAQLGGARLSAVEPIQFASQPELMEVALAPNSVFHNSQRIIGDLTPTPLPNYLFPGLGDTDESYDAPDFQNMYLAWLSASPRAHGMVMDIAGSVGTANLTYDALDPNVQQLYQQLDGCRLMIDDVPLPSFHRPDLAYFWFVRMFNAPWLSSMSPQQRTIAILKPSTIAASDPQLAAQITAIKRKFMLRPLREDHPNFDGSNVASRYDGNGPFAPWEVVGPWDVDNDNDGVPDSIWVDLGDPIQETDDGRLYRPLYAFLIIDLDSKLNLNAHGTSEHLVSTVLPSGQQTGALLDNVFIQTNGQSGNLAGGADLSAFTALTAPTSNNPNLGLGWGWGPAEISLRPLFQMPIDPNTNTATISTPLTDDYARLLYGRPPQTGPLPIDRVIFGRQGGFELMQTVDANIGLVSLLGDTQPGKSFKPANPINTRDPHTAFDFSGFPVFDARWVDRVLQENWPGGGQQAALQTFLVNSGAAQLIPNGPKATPSSFGTAPDLRGRTAVALDYTGQPVYESTWEWDPASPWGNNVLPLWPTADDSPYELNLTDTFRNDSVADARAMQLASVSGAPINDDAPFSIAELERILRANDADMGGVPDRLWNLVNAFDPVKLSATPWYLINFSDPTARLAQAQIETAANRRLVTTESSHVPVPAGNMYTRCLLGADGKPGKAGIDDNENGIIDDALEIGWCDSNFDTFLIDPNDPGSDSDDFGSVFRHLQVLNLTTNNLEYMSAAQALPVSGAGLVDYLRYRIILELFNKGVISDAIGNNLLGDADLLANPIIAQLMPPDVMAGLKMDLNRPFGDGRDNNGNGVVDEPLEAGEPFVDINGDRIWNAGEPFLDLDGDGRYYGDSSRPNYWVDLNNDGVNEHPVDNLWAEQLGSPVPFTYHPGMRGVFVTDNTNNVIGELINPYDTVRQLYARHLYILARLTMDENYVAPYDEDSLQLRTWMDKLKADLTKAPANLSPEDAELLIRKKLTYREVAQWAINSADMRDADVIMTPFEYDENPWDGWGVFDYDNNLAIPLDGDLRTDEDLTYVQNATTGNNARIIEPRQLTNVELNPLYKTRGVVWGAERPELLITETLGLHDRRTEDLQSNATTGHGLLNPPRQDDNKWTDEDLDQRYRPRGSLFVEVHNAWSDDGQKPAELYSLHRRNANGTLMQNPAGTAALPPQPSPGVELGRVSNVSEDGSIDGRRSPVWRLIVVEEHPEYRNDDDEDDERPDVVDMSQINLPQGPIPFRYSDPDFVGFDSSAKLLSGLPVLSPMDIQGTYRFSDPIKTQDWRYQRHRFGATYPYIEREFYFTTNYSEPLVRNNVAGNPLRWTTSRYDVTDANFKLRIPDRSLQYRLGNTNVRAQTQKFIHPDAEQKLSDPNDPNDPNLAWQIAPILPGSYGVIGSAGTRYVGKYTTQVADSFTTALGRLQRETDEMPINNNETSPLNPNLYRRIELRVGRHRLGALRSRVYDPTPAQNPNQVFVQRNGGKMLGPGGRDNELLNNAEVVGQYGPAVGIPVEDMNISEPSWEYQARQFEMSQKERGTGSDQLNFNPTKAKGDGTYVTNQGPQSQNPDSYDTPFDDAPELVRTGTTLNYRMIHLQRLANPLLPWNPPKLRPDGTPDPDHRDNLVINPYRTIDSSSVDLSAYNGMSAKEGDQPAEVVRAKGQLRPWRPQDLNQYVQSTRQRWLLRTHERGATAALSTLQGPPADSLPTRAIWQQEPAKFEYSAEYFLDLTPWVLPTVKEASDRMSMRMTMRGKQSRDAGFANDNTMHVDMVLEHSLGFGNESIGALLSWDPNPATLQAPTPKAAGAPAPELIPNTTLNTASTYPWLAWNNRPYSSGMELLQIPSRSSSEMLRNYSVTNPYADVDPYNGNLPAPATTPTPEELNDLRDANHHGHFGHLMNFVESAALPADVLRDPANGTPILDSTDAANPEYIPIGAPHYYRLLDYVYVPSKFVGTDTMLNPRVFNRNGEDLTVNTVDDAILPNDPRQSLLAPFNRVAKYREPGRVNINTISDARVWDGGVQQRTSTMGAYDPTTGHLGIPYLGFLTGIPTGPASAQMFLVPGIVDLRRGYGTGGGTQYTLDPAMPSIFSNPFRAGNAGDLVPLPNMVQQGSVNATLLRGVAVPNASPSGVTTEAAFADFSIRKDAPFFDVSRNPYLKYSALNKAGSSATTRSNVFAVWVTVGFFEVERAPDWTDPNVRARFNDDRSLYDRVYPEGYALAQEIGSDTGNLKRHRGFYIIDRSLPAGFMPGVDVNVDDLIKLRRRIE